MLDLCRRAGGMAAIAVVFALAATCRADESRPAAEPGLAPIAPAEMRAALESKTPIDHRLIKGPELSALMAGELRPKGGCDDHHRLIITNSTIEGQTDLSPSSAGSATAEDEEAATSTARPTDASRSWFRFPFAIKGSTINNQIRFGNIGFECEVDLSATLFRDRLLLFESVFGRRFKLDDSSIKFNFGSLGTEWLGPATFKRATFEAIAEFVTKRRGDKSAFEGNADFAGAVFSRGANFLLIDFLGPTNFANAQFGRAANFNGTFIRNRFGPLGPFYMAEFSGPAIFRNLAFTAVTFHKTVFKDAVDFHFAHGKNLMIRILTVPARIDLSDIKIDHLELDDLTVAGETNFQRASLSELDVRDVDFRKTVDLDEAAIVCSIRFDALSFGGDLRFEDAKLPSDTDAGKSTCDRHGQPPFVLKDVTFDNGVYASREQLLTGSPWWALWRDARPRFGGSTAAASVSDERASTGEDRRLWRQLVHGFDATGNLDLKTYSAYRLAYLVERSEDQPQRAFSAMSRWFWGYGFRPWRVLWWMAAVVVLYAVIYWTQLAAIGARETRIVRAFKRMRYALVFSGRTALRLTYGYDNSATSLFRAITTSESLVVKLLVACFFYALTQTSPFLSELVKKLLP